ncbi:hypothetical protein JDV02_009425 [Purpureocillium takamizusanense]|uniref:Uncharacterized protein n=1 Tax=Purpureocillium takamizusanense TaxID=2060973 RepID=A0A9Q8VFM9_9HYPO|nr:uncharacterized protein JDV02_009425 [Purpureocillium takamizusanense]UNI23616.1 hypothetical protein JDV02_009425 [Purpureocillium takamizusanense]
MSRETRGTTTNLGWTRMPWLTGCATSQRTKGRVIVTGIPSRPSIRQGPRRRTTGIGNISIFNIMAMRLPLEVWLVFRRKAEGSLWRGVGASRPPQSAIADRNARSAAPVMRRIWQLASIVVHRRDANDGVIVHIQFHTQAWTGEAAVAGLLAVHGPRP